MALKGSLLPHPMHDGDTILSGNGTASAIAANPKIGAVTGTVFRT